MALVERTGLISTLGPVDGDYPPFRVGNGPAARSGCGGNAVFDGFQSPVADHAVGDVGLPGASRRSTQPGGEAAGADRGSLPCRAGKTILSGTPDQFFAQTSSKLTPEQSVWLRGGRAALYQTIVTEP